MAMPNLEAALAAEHTISNKKAAVKKTQFGEFLPKIRVEEIIDANLNV